MKRRFVECAILLGVVMSVMFLAQTQEVIGHDEANHKPPGHNHNPSVRVDSVTGAPVTTGGVDPRGKHFSGTDGDTVDGHQTAWGFRYGGGTYATSPSCPDCDTQNVWSLRVDVEASTGSRHARVKVTPGIYLTHFHKDEGGWQGTATGTVTFSGVNYHTGLLCIRWGRETDSYTCTGFLDLEVKKAQISEEDVRKYGAGFESNGASLKAESEHKYTTSYDDLKARGYRFILELKGGFFDAIPRYQDKRAEGSGELMDGDIQSDTAIAEYKYTDWEDCYCGDSKKPLY